MRHFLAVFLLCAPTAAAWPAGYAFERTITVQSGQVTGTLTSFPMLVYGTYAYLKTAANGGYIQHTATLNSQTVPADLIFTSDSAGQSLLNWDIGSYTASTGAIEVWVSVPSMASGSVIYMWYGSAAATSYTGNATSTYDAYTQARWHYANGSSLTLTDSSVNAIAASSAADDSAATGQVDGAMALTGAGGSGINYGTPAGIPNNFPTVNAGVTICAWINPTASSDNIIGRSDANVAAGFTFSVGANYLQWQVVNTASDFTLTGNASSVTYNAWQHACVVATYSGTTEAATFYINGVAAGTGSHSGSQGTITTQYLYVGATNPLSAGTFAGSMDELVVDSTNRSAAWIAAEYANQSAPSSFYAVSAAIRNPGGLLIFH